ncbi:hypothetical protein [Hyphococcus luteus]|uniref:Uncharacterized protein n=1 Tax=Hyphococcus luteus TaxID=2058213 RepID=A0A2S7K7T8_9PROT|nr:hypothetical protein [Marinicaulis flavus]PQA88577.1 hypothetical protein CW354_09855 [Marinicaulis flavus]
MRLIAIFLAALFLAGAASAQAPPGYEKIYDEPTTVNLAGRPVIADIAFHADRAATRRGDLKLALVTDVTEFVTQTEDDLKNWIAARRNTCGERWKSGPPRIGFPESAIRFGIYLEIEYWSCGLRGQGAPTRLAQETGSVDVTLIPYIENGKLQARLGVFDLSEQTGLSKYLPLEFVVRRALEQELAKLNDNPKFYRAPQPLAGEGFVYEDISAAQTKDGRIVITALYRANGDGSTFDRIVRKLRADGVTQ